MLTPLNKRIIIKRDEAKTMTDGGLYIPEPATEKPVVGTIVTLALDCELLNQDAVGRKVMFGKYAGTELEFENDEGEKETFLLMNEKDLLGLL